VYAPTINSQKQELRDYLVIKKLVINLSHLNLSFSPLQLPFLDAATHQQAILLFPRFVKAFL